MVPDGPRPAPAVGAILPPLGPGPGAPYDVELTPGFVFWSGLVVDDVKPWGLEGDLSAPSADLELY